MIKHIDSERTLRSIILASILLVCATIAGTAWATPAGGLPEAEATEVAVEVEASEETLEVGVAEILVEEPMDNQQGLTSSFSDSFTLSFGTCTIYNTPTSSGCTYFGCEARGCGAPFQYDSSCGHCYCGYAF